MSTMPEMKSIKDIFPIIIEKYERFIPNIEGMGVPEKINAIIQYLNRIGKINQDVVDNWNVVMKWVLNDGLQDSVNAKVDDLIEKGTFNDLLNQMFDGIKENVDGSPKGVYTTLTNLQSAFPTGTTGIYLVTGDGGWYYYKNGWVKGGTYQSTGLANGSVTLNNLDSYFQSMFNQSYSSVSLTWHNGSYYNYTNGVITVGDTNYNYADVINVLPGETYKISGQSKWAADLYVITNASGNVLTAFPNRSDIKQTYTDVVFTIPSNGAKLLLNKSDGIPTTLYKVTAYNVDGGKILASTIDSSSMKDDTIGVKKLDPKLQNLFNDKYADVSITWTSGQYWAYNSGQILSSSEYSTSPSMVVNPGEKYRISGSSKWASNLYMIKDSVGNIISVFPNTNVTTVNYTDIDFIIPSNGAYLCVNQLNTNPTTLKKVDGYQLKVDGIFQAQTKLTIIGDSLSDMVGTATQKYHYWLGQNDNYKVTDLAKSGTGYYSDASISKQFYNQALSIPTDSEIVLIFGSFNDVPAMRDQGFPLGNVTDTGTTTIYGCMNKAIDNIYSVLPNAIIGLVTPTPWQYNTPMLVQGDSNYVALQYVEAIKSVGNRRGIPVLDLFRCSNLRPWDTTFRNTFYYSSDGVNGDGVHPNNEGHKKYIYPHMREFLKTLRF